MRLPTTKSFTLWMAGMIVCGVSASYAAIPLFVNHQGVLEVNGQPFSGNADFRFAFIDTRTANNLWTNDASMLGVFGTPEVAVSLPVVGGIFVVRLGDADLTGMTALPSDTFDGDFVAMRVWVDDGINGISRLEPDRILTSAPYAVHALVADYAMNATQAVDADTVDGQHAAAFAATSHIHDGAAITTGKISNSRLNTGADNGLDADTVDGQQASNFASASHSHDASSLVSGKLSNSRLNMGEGNGIDADTVDGLHAADLVDATAITAAVAAHAGSAGAHPTIELDGARITTGAVADARVASTLARDNEVFGIVASLDGSGSGLDADTVDGMQAAAFAGASHGHSGSEITSGAVAEARIDSALARDNEVFGIVTASDGAASGLDADTVDGLEGSDLNSIPSLLKLFGGDGSDGTVVISSTTEFSTLTGSVNDLWLQTEDFTIQSPSVLTVDTGWAFIGVRGTCTISGTINAESRGEPGGDGGSLINGGAGGRADMVGHTGRGGGSSKAGISHTDHSNSPTVDSNIGGQQLPVSFALAGAGGGGGHSAGSGTGGAGGGGGSFGGRGARPGENAVTTPAAKIRLLSGGGDGGGIIHGISQFNPILCLHRGAGGGAGGSDSGHLGGKGGDGGGVIYIECDTLSFDGILTADGGDGGDGASQWGGAGGGGGGGIILVRARDITTNTGSVSATGGQGGTGGSDSQAADGGDGADGFSDIVDVD